MSETIAEVKDKKLTKKQKAALKAEKRWKRDVNKRNEAFRKMKPNKQRMEIAEEILKLLRPRKDGFPIAHMSRATGYINIDFDKKLGEVLQKKDDWQVVFKKYLPKIETCEVCMLGITALASIRLRDSAPIRYDEYVEEGVGVLSERGGEFGQSDCFDVLEDLFTEDELQHMEKFFERDSRRVSSDDAAKILWGTVLKNRGEYDKGKIEKAYAKAVERQRPKKESNRS